MGGRFGVDEGSQCVEDIKRYLNKLKTNEKLKKVIFSRDIHTTSPENPNHCSFVIESSRGRIDGIGFPSHCVNGTNGCMLHRTIQDECEQLGDKAIVVMKGCNEDTESFGAYPYSCDEGNAKTYTDLRQHNGCKKTCETSVFMDSRFMDSGFMDSRFMKKTGGLILNGKHRFAAWVPPKTRRTIVDWLNIELSQQYIEGKPGVLHLVCGLAGDYCVRDTAINLKLAFPGHTVAVIADAVRYPALPVGAILPQDNTITVDTLEQNLHLKSFNETVGDGLVPKYFITPADTLLFTYDKRFFGNGNEVIFTIDDTNTGTLLSLQDKVNGSIENGRPTRDDNKYWCLARYMHLMGKQLKRPEFNNAIGIAPATIDGKNVTGQLILRLPERVSGGKRTRKANKKKHTKRKGKKSNKKTIKRKTRR